MMDILDIVDRTPPNKINLVPKSEILTLGEINPKSDKENQENKENKESQINRLGLLLNKNMLMKGKRQLRALIMFTLI
jgi:hypothetical protein